MIVQKPQAVRNGRVRYCVKSIREGLLSATRLIQEPARSWRMDYDGSSDGVYLSVGSESFIMGSSRKFLKNETYRLDGASLMSEGSSTGSV